MNNTVQSFFKQLSRPFGRESVLLLLRMWLGLIMVYHGSDKLFRSLDPFTQHLTTFGIPLSKFVSGFFTVSQLVGGTLLFFGLLTRPALVCIVLTVFSAVVEAMFFVNYDPFSRKGELAFTYMILGFALLVSGPGMYSLDYFLSHFKQTEEHDEAL
ncbi:MAG: DoxX family protein [Candidatus Kapabacteria bacterium]|nr:DoxX family protein [Candidatus Kapabacteria bacterium]